MEPLIIDGSQGEGGGQILRTSLSLSMITGRPVVIEKVRAKRKKPGLQPQHLTAVNAARTLCNGTVQGAELQSGWLRFVPGPVSAGTYHFPIGTAGASTLVMQTVLPALLLQGSPSRATFEGGTLNPMAPPFDFVERVFVPALRLMGAKLSLRLERHGFYPQGGGRWHLEVQPAPLRRLELLDAGEPKRRVARVLLSKLGDHVANRELKVVRERLGFGPHECRVEHVEALSPGNAVLLELDREPLPELASSIGERGKPAEQVAADAVEELKLLQSVPVGPHLADQLLLPMAVGEGGAFRTTELTPHSLTNIAVIEAFGVASFEVARASRETTVTVSASSRTPRPRGV